MSIVVYCLLTIFLFTIDYFFSVLFAYFFNRKERKVFRKARKGFKKSFNQKNHRNQNSDNSK
jgi:hypothetical protein